MNLPPVAWCEVDCQSGAIRQALDELGGEAALLKTVRGGYDGKGQWLVSPQDDLDNLCTHVESFLSVAEGGNTQLILEERITDAREISAIIARRADGDYALFPLSENDHEGGILRRSRAPACIDPDSAHDARQAAISLAESLNVVGLLAVEMFLLPAGTILLNEIAPRPHNSGHWTLDGCMTSQFEQLVRAICDLPLGCTAMSGSEAEMTNLLGNQVVAWRDYLAQPEFKLHLYGKAHLRPGRKMGHVTRILRK